MVGLGWRGKFHGGCIWHNNFDWLAQVFNLWLFSISLFGKLAGLIVTLKFDVSQFQILHVLVVRNQILLTVYSLLCVENSRLVQSLMLRRIDIELAYV